MATLIRRRSIMTIPGNECPDCGKRLSGADSCHNCGWAPGTDTTGRTPCASCRTGMAASQLSQGEDNLRRCASCHMEYLRQRAALDHESSAEHIAEFRRIVASAAWAERFDSRRG